MGDIADGLTGNADRFDHNDNKVFANKGLAAEILKVFDCVNYLVEESEKPILTARLSLSFRQIDIRVWGASLMPLQRPQIAHF